MSSTKESGVDMAFDALMDLEENADLVDFMKNHQESGEEFAEIWSLGSGNVTNKNTGQTLR